MIHVFDGVLPNPEKYREEVLSLEFKTYDFGHCQFHGIAVDGPAAGLLASIHEKFQALAPTLTFFRKSPLGQEEPHYIHTDVDMGEWSAILYLNPNPEKGDGTWFWQHDKTGAIESSVPHERSVEGRTPEGWVPHRKVWAKFNRLLMFKSTLFHSRAIAENWGQGNDARLIQVAFGTGAL